MTISERTPFIDYFVNKTFTQNYPPEKWHVRIYNRVWGHADHIQELVNYHVTNGDKKFASFELKQPKVIIHLSYKHTFLCCFAVYWILAILALL